MRDCTPHRAQLTAGDDSEVKEIINASRCPNLFRHLNKMDFDSKFTAGPSTLRLVQGNKCYRLGPVNRGKILILAINDQIGRRTQTPEKTQQPAAICKTE